MPSAGLSFGHPNRSNHLLCLLPNEVSWDSGIQRVAAWLRTAARMLPAGLEGLRVQQHCRAGLQRWERRLGLAPCSPGTLPLGMGSLNHGRPTPTPYGARTSPAPCYKCHSPSKRGPSFALTHTATPAAMSPSAVYAVASSAVRTETSFKFLLQHLCPYLLLTCTLIPDAPGSERVGVGRKPEPALVFIFPTRGETSQPFS